MRIALHSCVSVQPSHLRVHYVARRTEVSRRIPGVVIDDVSRDEGSGPAASLWTGKEAGQPDGDEPRCH